MTVTHTTERPLTLEVVREQKAYHRAAITKHQSALNDLEAAERVLLALNAPVSTNGSTTSIGPDAAVQKQLEAAKATKKRALLTAIAASTQGLTTQGAIASAQSGGAVGLRVDNVSPKLSAYKADGLLELDRGLWKITDKGRGAIAPKE